MLDLIDSIDFLENVLRESHDPRLMREMLRKEHRRLVSEFNRLEAEMMKEAA
jgi:hypothetical protein